MNNYIKEAEKYMKNCLFDGLAHSYDTRSQSYVKPYPEVTGYVIKYLVDNCDMENDPKIIEARNTLLSIQHKKGGFRTFYENRNLYAFDTAQIMNGLISLYNKRPDEELLAAIKRGGEFLLSMQRKDGAFYPVYDCLLHMRRMPRKMYSLWNGPTSGINCKLTEVLSSFYNLTKDERYNDAIKKAACFYKKVNPIIHSHPLGYWLEGLYQAGEIEFVKNHLINNVLQRIEENGFMSYDTVLDYSYMSGQIQLGILLAKIGEIEAAKKLRDFARLVQKNNQTGGIIQFATRDGKIDNHVHEEVNSWGTKYYCELERLLEQYE